MSMLCSLEVSSRSSRPYSHQRGKPKPPPCQDPDSSSLARDLPAARCRMASEDRERLERVRTRCGEEVESFRGKDDLLQIAEVSRGKAEPRHDEVKRGGARTAQVTTERRAS